MKFCFSLGSTSKVIRDYIRFNEVAVFHIILAQWWLTAVYRVTQDSVT